MLRPVLVVALVTAACTETLAPTPVPVAGTYGLSHANRSELPVVLLIVPPESFWLVRGSLVLRDDSTFVDSIMTTIANELTGATSGDTSVTRGGYSLDGNLVVLKPDSRSAYTLTRDGSTLTRYVVRQHASARDLTLRYVK